LKIVVCVKQVPDSAAKVVVEDGRITWGDAPLVINPWDEFAVEAALMQQEALGGDVIALSIGGESAKEALKHALAMGCGEAILVSDPALASSDSQGIARVLAAAIRKIGDVDLTFFGKQAIDGDMGVTAAQTANVRSGPGTVYDWVDFLYQGVEAQIVGRYESESDGTWWLIHRLGQGLDGWVWGGVTTVSGDVSGIPYLIPPPTPTPGPSPTPVPTAATPTA